MAFHCGPHGYTPNEVSPWAPGIIAALILVVLGQAGCGSPSSAVTEPACVAPAGVSGSPGTIADVVALANGMLATRNQPLSVSCFVRSLDRPLSVLPISSVFSLQPSAGARSPRIFLWSGNIVMSVAPAGDGRNRMELAEYPSPTRSIKGEIVFPVESPLASSSPYDHILATDGRNGSICGGCHPQEEPALDVSNAMAFESQVVRPSASAEVPVSFMEDQTRTCDSAAEPERCSLLTAIFAGSHVTVRQFSADAPTIYGQ